MKFLRPIFSAFKIIVFIALEAALALGGYMLWLNLPIFSVNSKYPMSAMLPVIRDNLWFLISLIFVNFIFWKCIEHWQLPKFCGYKGLIYKTITAILLGYVWVGISLLILIISSKFGLIEYLSFSKSNIIFLNFMVWGKLSSAFMQEFALRGYVYTYLETKYSYKVAIVSTSLLFGMWHMGKFLYGPLAFINVFFLGFFLAVVRWRSNSLWMTAIVHYVWNATFFITVIEGKGNTLWIGAGYGPTESGIVSLGLDHGLLYTVSTLLLTIILIFCRKRKTNC